MQLSGERRLLLSSLLLIIFAGVGLRLVGIWFGWPFVFHADEAKSIVPAVRFLDVRNLDLNPHLFTYPTLYAYLVAVASGVLGGLAVLLGRWPDFATFYLLYQDSPAVFHLTGRLVTATFGVATVYVVYRVGRHLWDERVGVAAALLVSLNFLHIRESQFATVDVPLTFFVTSAFLAACVLHRFGRLRDYLVAGILVGLATATKQPGIIAMAPLLAAHGLFSWQQGPRKAAALFSPKLLAGLGAAAGGFLVGCPYCLVDLPTFVDFQVREWSHTQYGLIGGFAAYWVDFFPPLGMGWAALGLAVIGLAYGAVARSGGHILLLSFVLPFYLVVGSAPHKIERYILPLIPFLCLAGAFFSVRAVERFLPRRFGVLGALAIAVLAMAPTIWLTLAYLRATASTDTRVAARNWIVEHVPPDAGLAMPWGDFWWTSPPLTDQAKPLIEVWAAGSSEGQPPLEGWTKWGQSPGKPFQTVVPTAVYGEVDRIFVILHLIKNGTIDKTGAPHLAGFDPRLIREVSLGALPPSPPPPPPSAGPLPVAWSVLPVAVQMGQDLDVSVTAVAGRLDIVPIVSVEGLAEREWAKHEERLRQGPLIGPLLRLVPAGSPAPQGARRDPNVLEAFGPGGSGPPPIAYYRSVGVSYLVVNSYFWGIFERAPAVSNDVGKAWREFFRSLDQEARLVREFEPGLTGVSPSFALGPTIRIYALD